MNTRTSELHDLKQSLEEFIRTAEGFPDELRLAKPTEKAFSATEIVYHMCDVETLWQDRLGKLLSGESREFIAMDPDKVALDNAYNSKNFAAGVAQLREGRQITLELFAELTDEQFDLAGMHTKYGEMSIARIVETMTNHDRQHARQLRRTESELRTASELRSTHPA
jgi:uncharacterized damage-inducible protein DinB